MSMGVDSVAAADSSYGGKDLASYVRSYPFYPPLPTFWGRYFGGYNMNFTVMNLESASEIRAECTDMKARGFRWIIPLNSPQGINRVAGTSTDGTADAQAFCKGIGDAIAASGGLLALPGNNHLRVYLDVEPHAPFSPQYWNGWCETVYSYQYGQGAPFYPACYCDPADGQPCVVFQNNNLPVDAVWANMPNEGCATVGCIRAPSWGPDTCSGVYTSLWQYNIDTVCQSCLRGFPPVDIDLANPGATETNYMLYLP